MKRVGVDVGGTFTDLIEVDDETGTILVHKLPTTPDDPSKGTVQGIREIAAEAGIEPSDLDQVFHGTTIATNIVIEHNGAKVGMLTTEGYRDILHIARHKKPLNFSNYQDLPWQRYPIVRRRYRRTVPERITRDGEVLVPLDEERARERVRELKEAGVEAVAVCFLFSFLNPDHEAARRGDRPRGVPGGVPLGLLGGPPAVPRVRAILDRLPQRLRRPEGRDATCAVSRTSCGAWASAPASIS